MPINCPLVPKLDLWLRTINTDLCVCLFFSALLSLLLWCFNTIAVAIHISGLIEVFVHLVCRKLVFFLFLFGCRRLAIWILLLFQLLLLLLLQLLALFGLVLFFYLFHFKTQNSKKFRNPKDSVATQSLKVFSSSTHCWLMLCFLSYYQQKRHLDIAVVNVHLLYHTTFLLAKYSKTTVIWVVFGIKVVWSYFQLLSYSVGSTSVGSSACLADFYAGCSSWQHQNN